MIKRTFNQVVKMVDGTASHQADVHITGVSTDSRQAQKGSLFIPLVGEKFDGHQFVEKAFENGAVATLWDRSIEGAPENYPVIFVDDTLKALQLLAHSYLQQVQPKVVGITGSNGKTTTKDLVAGVLSTTYKVHKTNGNFNNHIGMPLTILSMPEDTEVAVLEMGMSGRGEIELLSMLAQPDVAVITNIGEAHLLDLGSREGIAEAKLEILAGLKPEGVFIYDGDEPLLRKDYDKYETVTFGQSKHNTLYPISVMQKEDSTEFTCNNIESQINIPVLGRHNVLNALAAICVGKALNVTEENMIKGLKQVQMSNMRLEMQQGPGGLTVINDAYNASPTSVKAAIQLLKDMTGFGQKILVLGDMLELGDEEIRYHQEVGESVKDSGIAYLYTYGTLGQEIAKGAKGHLPEDRILAFTDKQQLIQHLRSVVTPKDVVLVKAKDRKSVV